MGSFDKWGKQFGKIQHPFMIRLGMLRRERNVLTQKMMSIKNLKQTLLYGSEGRKPGPHMVPEHCVDLDKPHPL